MSVTSDIESTIAALDADLHRVDATGLLDQWINRLQGFDGQISAAIVDELRHLRGMIGGSTSSDITKVADSLQKLSNLSAQAAYDGHSFAYDALRHLNQKLASAAGQIRAGL
ncbi:hypothetical protein MUN82_02370 [Hymenobacter aerilatus]|uniref:Uncharacterized protein n=1 Tax=Hymenobacter aerilatus TaxID=2932251 RepID=A0A8T9SW40_9BACT|nr:hypothetical protein [Hymenobacter aerilatus]UOR05957.1 hypothetical protein MUN82_02370 [Hymenobacter aerilatus]